jgi:hypothetical protein
MYRILILPDIWPAVCPANPVSAQRPDIWCIPTFFSVWLKWHIFIITGTVDMSAWTDNLFEKSVRFTDPEPAISFISFRIRSLNTDSYFKGTVSRDFRPLFFFHQITSPRPLIYGLKPFCIWLCIREDIWLTNCRLWPERCQWNRSGQKRSLDNPYIFCVIVTAIG